MNRYEYLNQVSEDVRNYVENEIDLTEWVGDRDGLEQHLNDELFCCDSVTGNASGSYTFNTWQAEENIAHAWDLIEEAAEAYGIEPTISCSWDHGAEWWDVAIRCHLLPEAVAAVLDDLEENGAFDDPEADVI